MAEAASPRRRSKKIVEAEGVAHIKATFNNTLITITDNAGNTIVWGSAGKAGFKGSKKSTPFAATVAAEQCGREAVAMGVKRVNVRVHGPGSGRESAIQALSAAGLQIKAIQDVTPLPHNGMPPAQEAPGLEENSMARYTGPVCKLCRREGQKLFPEGTEVATRRSAP